MLSLSVVLETWGRCLPVGLIPFVAALASLLHRAARNMNFTGHYYLRIFNTRLQILETWGWHLRSSSLRFWILLLWKHRLAPSVSFPSFLSLVQRLQQRQHWYSDCGNFVAVIAACHWPENDFPWHFHHKSQRIYFLSAVWNLNIPSSKHSHHYIPKQFFNEQEFLRCFVGYIFPSNIKKNIQALFESSSHFFRYFLKVSMYEAHMKRECWPKHVKCENKFFTGNALEYECGYL